MEPVSIETLGTSRKDIEWYLLTWLQPIKPEENAMQFVIDGKLYYQIMGFRRGFCCHMVLREVNGESFAFHVASDVEDQDCRQFEPNMGIYNSFAELLTGVTDMYFTRWNSYV
jgi:hypothetical protein